jgi:regulator of nonsense transcripts 1
MLDGLYSFVNDENSVSSYIYYKLLGHNTDDKRFNYNIPKDLTVKGLPELNYFQTLGIKKALQTPLFLIQGPPGTGKTVTSAAIVYHLSQLKIGKILVCTPSNIAADQLSEKISRTGLKVVRLCAKSRESISTKVEDLSLHRQIKNLPAKDYKRLFELMKIKEETGDIKKEDHELYKKLKHKAEG